jgi:hypothetical protein
MTNLYEDVISLILFFLWDVVLWALAIGKIVQSGLSKYAIHLTNWGWTLSLILFTFDILSRFDQRKVTKRFPLRTDSMVTVVFFWITNGINWLIFWLFLIIINNNPNVIESEFKSKGGQYQDGEVFVFNTVFHVLPSLMMLVYSFLRRGPIERSIRVFTSRKIELWIGIMFAISEILIFPGFVGMMYFLCTDTSVIYNITVPNVVLTFVGIAILILHNGILFGLYYFQIRKTIQKK